MTKLLNSSLGIIVLIFFFNRFALPFGLEYSLLFTPFFLYYLYKTKKLVHTIFPYYLIFGFTIIHIFLGVVMKDFFISTAVMCSIVLLATSFYYFYQKVTDIDFIIKSLTLINAALTAIAVISLITNIFVPVFWYLEPFTAGYQTIPRLKLFELEASHYSFLLLPLFYFYFWKLLKHWNRETAFLLFSILLSLLLSFSLGILAVVFISIFVVGVVHLVPIARFSPTRNKFSLLLVSGVAVLVILWLFFPSNPLFFRIENLLAGDDTSGRGRTYEAMEIAWLVAHQNNPFVGIGLGQFKIIGRETLIYYYKFANMPEVARLPNAMAETLVTYGIIGFGFRLLIQLWLFIKLKVFNNLFQFSLFVALFIYQFTGSYLSNEMEYILWIMVFVNKLPYFQLPIYFKK